MLICEYAAATRLALALRGFVLFVLQVLAVVASVSRRLQTAAPAASRGPAVVSSCL